jgi:hypothetical protein
MNGLTLAFHGSEVAAIDIGPGSVVVRFAVAQAWRAAEGPGRQPVEGYVPALELSCTGAVVSLHEGPCIGRLSDGLVTARDTRWRRLPLPFETTGPVGLRLDFANGALLAVQAAHLRLGSPGELRFFDSCAC